MGKSGKLGRSGKRAQSETIGFVLLFAVVLLSAGVIISFGVTAVNESEESLSADRAEKVMTQMDSEISMVALGRTDSQEISFDRVPGEQFSIDETSGQINITTIGKNPEVILPDTRLGAVKFERGDTVIAYQGGGVWRSDGPGSGMISPPEFNYRDQTLTLPLVTVTGEPRLARGAVIDKDIDNRTTHFPNATAGFTNPLEDEIVQVTIESEFHDGWKSYFESRTEGAVRHEPEAQRVTVNLTAAAVLGFNHAAQTTTNDVPSSKNNGEIIGSTRTNITAPSVSPDVDSKISECSASSDPSLSIGTTLSQDRYCEGSSFSTSGGDTLEFDTSSNDIDVVIDGDLDMAGSSEITVAGDGRVRFYIKGDVDMAGTADTDNGPENIIVLVHSDADSVEFVGDQDFNGYIYAPNSIYRGKGNGVGSGINGGVIASEVDAQNSNINHVNPGFQIEIGQGINALTFLHISTNPVTISST